MDDKSLKIPEPELIKIDLAKSCYLLLTHEEYRRGIARGKNERRRLANEARLEKENLEKASISFPYSPGSP
mgnify:FL=1